LPKIDAASRLAQALGISLDRLALPGDKPRKPAASPPTLKRRKEK
jgi:hypothetical protein